jgi:type I restriction enzyme S subunit
MWSTVGDLLAERPYNGLSIKGSEQPPGVPALKLSAMTGAGFDYAQIRYLPLKMAAVGDLAVTAGDFFVSRGNGSLHLVGRGTVAQEPPFTVIYPDTMIRLRLLEPLRTTRWVSAVWASPLVRQQLEKKAKTTAGIWKLSQEDIASLELPLPPLAEQHRIVAAIEQHLSDIDAGVAALERVLLNLKRYRASALRACFTGNLPKVPMHGARRKETLPYRPDRRAVGDPGRVHIHGGHLMQP